MKRLWLILLSLGLIAAFSTSAMAVDVKFSGEFYAAGMYQDKTDLCKDCGNSTAFYFQRLRLNTQFIVAPGLTLTTRLDAMERAWGAARTAPDAVLQGFAANVQSAGTIAENENIAFDLAYVTYISPIGMFSAGYQIDGAWGTVFGDNSIPTGKVSYIMMKGPVTLIAQMGKNSAFNAFVPGIGGEQSSPYGQNIILTNNNFASDRDNNFYTLAARYAWNSGQAGLLYKYVRIATLRGEVLAGEPTINIHVVIPYFKTQFGPVAVEGEIMHAFGEWDRTTFGNSDNRSISVLNAYLNANADFDQFYFGGTFAYLSGQDPNAGRQMQGIIDGGWDWNPMLILWNSDRTQWAGGLWGCDGNANTAMANAWFLQARGGIRPIEKLNIGLAVSYANAVVKPTNTWKDNNYGWEVDLTGTYKITNNLSYMLGAGYLFTGKYFGGAGTLDPVSGFVFEDEVQNNFLVINKLTLTF